MHNSWGGYNYSVVLHKTERKGLAMRRIFILAFMVVVFALSIVGCNADKEEIVIDPNALSVISNISENGGIQAKGLEYTKKNPIKGVLLRYHSDGLVDPETSVFKDEYNETSKEFTNQNAFYIEYIENPKSTNYETLYNYVLYVPDSVKQAYKDAGGTNPEYGNAFWWYIFQYYGSLDANRSDWEEVFDYLLNHRYNLSNAHKNDVGSNWLEETIKAAITARDPDGKTLRENICFGHWYNDEPNGKSSVKANRIMYFEDGRRCGSGSNDTRLFKIFIPIELSKAYSAGSGKESKDDEALLWYFSTYYHVSIEELTQVFEKGEIGRLIEDCYRKYGYIEPSPFKVREKTAETIVEFELENKADSEMLMFGDFYYYLPESLKLEDGTIIEDNSRVYFTLNSNTLFVYYPITYLIQMKSETEARGDRFQLNGSEFWNFFHWFCSPSLGDINSDDCEISVGMFKKMLEYRSYEGIKTNY